MVRRNPVAACQQFHSRPLPLRRAGAVGSVLFALLVLGGCGGSRAEVTAEAVSDPASLIDGYLIARGMALSYGHSGRAGATQIAQLIQYDRAALIAVATAQLEPGDARSRQAERALQALVDYTGENDLRPDQLPP